MMSEKDNHSGTADYYDTHDISVEMEAGQWSRHEGEPPETAMSGFNTRLPTAVLNDARAAGSIVGLIEGKVWGFTVRVTVDARLPQLF